MKETEFLNQKAYTTIYFNIVHNQGTWDDIDSASQDFDSSCFGVRLNEVHDNKVLLTNDWTVLICLRNIIKCFSWFPCKIITAWGLKEEHFFRSLVDKWRPANNMLTTPGHQKNS